MVLSADEHFALPAAIFKAGRCIDPMWLLLRIAGVKQLRSVHRLKESAALFLSVDTFPQFHFRCARQNDPKATATGVANFHVARDAGTSQNALSRGRSARLRMALAASVRW